jgi:protein kinase A
VLSIASKGHIKLVDFGFAKNLGDSSAKTFTNCGTPVYLAPEVLRNHGHSFPVDVWSFGILLVEMVSGSTPFQGENTI